MSEAEPTSPSASPSATPSAGSGAAAGPTTRSEAAAALPPRIAFLGFGLIGGSIALALRGAGSTARLTAWTPSGHGPASAARRGVIDVAAPTAPEAIEGADLIVLAGPPLAIVGMAEALGGQLGRDLTPGATITDVGSTKARIGAVAESAGLHFVGGHPMAGRETSGFESAAEALFVDKPWVVVPGAGSTPVDMERVESLALACGARPIRMGAEDHDSAVAAISHLPLLVAAALVESVASPAVGGATWPLARRLASSGWADMTRLAKGDPEMGAGIVATNYDALADRLVALRDVLQAWIDRIAQDPADPDGIRDKLAGARRLLEEDDIR